MTPVLAAPVRAAPVLEARGLGKRYRRRWALTDCTLTIPAGHVVGLVGPNGAGKTTMLNLAVGLLPPTTGTISVLGGAPAAGPAQLARAGTPRWRATGSSASAWTRRSARAICPAASGLSSP